MKKLFGIFKINHKGELHLLKDDFETEFSAIECVLEMTDSHDIKAVILPYYFKEKNPLITHHVLDKDDYSLEHFRGTKEECEEYHRNNSWTYIEKL